MPGSMSSSTAPVDGAGTSEAQESGGAPTVLAVQQQYIVADHIINTCESTKVPQAPRIHSMDAGAFLIPSPYLVETPQRVFYRKLPLQLVVHPLAPSMSSVRAMVQPKMATDRPHAAPCSASPPNRAE